MARLFGTDGVRGIANTELNCELAMRIGAAGAYVLTSEVHRPRILLSSDTRKSADMLCAALSAGICSVGGDVLDIGVLPTPALAYLVRLYEADAAVMVSASHNPMEYNGIKWFDDRGNKLSDELEDKIEAILCGGDRLPKPTGGDVGRIIRAKHAQREYREFLRSTAKTSFEGLFVVLDCANGAASHIAKDVLTSLGANVVSFEDEPDGHNINEMCGSTHPQRLRQLVAELGADVGFSFDGDADRVIACDERGNIVDGDRILGMCAIAMKREGRLKNETLVITVMSNLGLKKRMRDEGVKLKETAVGDRYVLECMMREGYSLGGEQSGHIIFLDHNSTGDGVLTAIQVLNVLKKSGEKMSTLANEIPLFPQVLVNVEVDNAVKALAMDDELIRERIKGVEAALGDCGRTLVRASGTEPLIRIMLEGESEEAIRAYAVSLARVIEAKYGGKIK